MDDRTVGRLSRAIRVQRGLRQFDVAIRAAVSQSLVSATGGDREDRDYQDGQATATE